MSYDSKIAELGLKLPDAPKPLGSYVPAVITGNLLYLSGMLPLVDGALTHKGKVEGDVTRDEANAAARTAALNALGVARTALGSLDRIVRCVKLTGYVASDAGFAAQPYVINGASDLMAEVFGDAGRHARAAVGVPVLPLDSPVEIDFIFEIAP